MRDYLAEVEQQLVELTERGAHRRPRVRADLIAIAATVAVVAAVAAVVASVGSGTHRTPAPAVRPHPAPKVHRHSVRTVTVAPSQTHVNRTPAPAGGPVPPGFGPSSFTAISELTWWMLGQAPCASPPCTSIVRTTNGGRSFVGIPAPRTDAVSQLRFADPREGFAYGPELWVTHDGGTDWHRVDLGGRVTDLSTSGGWVFAVVQRGNTSRLERSPADQDQWVWLRAAGVAIGGLWTQSELLVEAANGSGQQLMDSHDEGGTFVADPVPPSVQCQFQAPGWPVVWEHCATGTMSGIWRSSDFGKTSVHIGAAPELPNSAAFAAASASTAVVGWNQLYRTTDAGASWSQVATSGPVTQWQWLGFTDASHGAALALVGQTMRLYYTTDGGASYHEVPIA